MTNLLKLAANVLQSEMEQHASEEVEYERLGVGKVHKVDDNGDVVKGSDGQPIYTVTAVIGESQFSQDDQTGLIDRIIRNDYIIRCSNLVINGQRTKPQRNDIIRQTLDDGTILEGRVLGEGGIPHYQASDEHGVAWRIHTKRDEII